MIVGVNKVYTHAGRDYHIQAEDLGVTWACFEIRVYDKGTVLWRKRVGYEDVIKQGLPRLEQDEALRSMMEKTIHTVQAAIAKGKISG
jgi:hypothetical protein